MKIFFLAGLTWLLVLLAPARLAMAEEADPARELDRVQQEQAASTEAQATLIRAMAEAIRAQEDLSGKLVDMARTATDQEAALVRANARIDALNAGNAEAQLALAGKWDALSSLLAGLQRLEQNPPPALVVQPGDVLKALRGAMMFGAVIPEVRKQTEELRSALAHVEKLKAELAAEKAKASATLASLDSTRKEMARLLDDKKALAESQAADLARERARAEELAAKARDLQELLAGLEKSRAEEAKKHAAAEQARLAAEAEAERLRVAALAKPPMVFSQALGQLAYPVQGRILTTFGADNGLGGQLDGQLLETAAQAQVLSPVDGRVEFSGTFRSYDKLVIINPGEGYLVLLAGMAEIVATPGQTVRAGEPVGMMGTRPAPMALAADLMKLQAPVLYVEFRKKNRSLDPAPWWVSGKKEAMR